MNKLTFASCFIALALGWSISMNSVCSCDQYILSTECKLNSCNWNVTSATCSQYICSSLSQSECRQEAYDNCYANSTGCFNYPSSCSSLAFNNANKCNNAGCDYVSGDSCADWWACSNYDSTNCPIDDYCQVVGTNCQAITQCSQLAVTHCPTNLCQIISNTCVPQTCSSQPSYYCYFVYNSLDMSSTSITPCILSGGNCVDASIFDLNSASLCQEHTDYLYRWSSTNSTNGTCVSCYGILFQILSTIILLWA